MNSDLVVHMFRRQKVPETKSDESLEHSPFFQLSVIICITVLEVYLKAAL